MISYFVPSFSIHYALISFIQDALAEQTYNPYLAGLSTAFDLNSRGITLRVMGYDEKQAKFVDNLIHRMVNFVPGGS